ncbi:MAG TPA: hypothetical protein VK988_00885 [Acidimicrobiales bacterium]|nr:hypothetical protein [Acidimicrobiales bacterium]
MAARYRKGLLAGTVAIGAVMALSSAALACTVFQGKMTVQGDASTTQSIVYGSGSWMSYCSITGGATASRLADSTPDLTIGIYPNTISGCTNQLGGSSGATYDVNFMREDTLGNAPYRTDSSGNFILQSGTTDCKSPTLPGAVKIGTITVDSTGHSLDTSGVRGTRSYGFGGHYRANDTMPPGDASGVCVSDSAGIFGNEAPIYLI